MTGGRRWLGLAPLVLVIGALLVPRAAAMPIQPLSSSLDEELHAAGGSDAALVVLDRPGSPALYAHRPTTPRILASNTKLFTTAAGLAHFGSRIASLVRRILLPSDNRLAQDLSNRLGNGSRSRGAAAAVTYAHRLGAHPRLVDGSGLSRSDSASPLDIVHLLTGMEHTRNFSIWVNALPNAGRSGTLQYRMRGTPAAGRCAAKTGTLRDVSALSGYCRTLHGHRVIFSLLFNRVNTHRAEAAEDRMVVRIVRDG